MMELDNRYDSSELKNPRLVDGVTFDTALRETEVWDELWKLNIVRDVPDMAMDDIYKLTYDEIEKILDGYNRYPWSDEGLHEIVKKCHSDNVWKYIEINGKKLYVQLEYGNHEILKSGKSCILLAYSEGEIFIDGIWRYDWKDFNGVVNKNGKMKKWKIELFDSRYK